MIPRSQVENAKETCITKGNYYGNIKKKIYLSFGNGILGYSFCQIEF
jgi:hypothetical protein